MSEISKLENQKSLIDAVNDAEKIILNEEQVECPVYHSFGPNIYMREVHIKAGTFAIGHHQNFEHVNIFVKGKARMLNDDGTFTVLTAPMLYIGKPGRKVAFAIEDMIWVNVYSETDQNIENLENKLLTKSLAFEEKTKLLSNLKLLNSNEERIEYYSMLDDLNIKDDEWNNILKRDIGDLPLAQYKFKTGSSNIHGRGIFATANIDVNEEIGPCRWHGKNTMLMSFLNHSFSPNCKISMENDFKLIAIKYISGCHGGMDGDEMTIDYRDIFNFFIEENER